MFGLKWRAPEHRRDSQLAGRESRAGAQGQHNSTRFVFLALLASVLAVALVLGSFQINPGALTQPTGSTLGNLKAIFTIGTVEAATTPDYTVDGVADDVQFQAALNALPSTGGELKVISSGTFNFAATVSRAINNVTISGTGIGTYFANNGATAIFSAGSQSGWVFRDFKTDAGGITLTSATGYVLSNVTMNTTVYPAVARTATKIVAASNATPQEKAGADYLCDGTADNVEIQSAITALTSGGLVSLSTGTFNVATQINLADKIWVRGSGGNTKLLATAGVSILKGLNLGSQTSSVPGVKISDMFLDGAWIAGTRGIYLDGVLFPVVENVYFDKFNVEPIRLEASAASDRNTAFGTFNHIKVFNGIYGIALIGSGLTKAVTINNFSNIDIWGVNNAASTLINLSQYCDSNKFDNIFLALNFAGSTGVIINSASAADDMEVYENHFTKLNIDMTAADTYPIDGNRTTAGFPSYIELRTGGAFSTNPCFIQANSEIVFRNSLNGSLKSENSGTGTINNASTSAVITHNLLFTPTAAEITITLTENPTNTPGAIWVDTIGATQFTVNCENDPGASNLDFSWSAKRK